MSALIPENPVDRFVIDWWDVDTSFEYAPIRHQRAIYYANANLKTEIGISGSDLIDQWMVFDIGDEGTYPTGRIEGWSLGNALLRRERRFTDRKEAVRFAINSMLNARVRLIERITTIDRMVKRLEAE